jgi:electron transport complex protein RnfG
MKIVIHMITTLTLIGVIVGGLLSEINDWASPLIAANQKAETEKAIFLVQPEGKSYETIPKTGIEIYRVYGADKNLVGYSMVSVGNGFQGKVKIMTGLSKDLSEINIIEILEQVETPGLGTKITEEPFKDQFKGLQTTPQVNWVKGKVPEQPNEIQTITGATISSKSVVTIINSGLAQARNLKERGVL